MIAELQSDQKNENRTYELEPSAQLTKFENTAFARIDIAKVVGSEFLVYGWVFGFTKLVDSATICLDGNVIDLAKQAIRVPRPDVTKHFSIELGNDDDDDDDHGFYVLFNLPGKITFADNLLLSITLCSGKTEESRWPVEYHERLVLSEIAPYETTLNSLLQQLSRQEAKRLIHFAMPVLQLPMNVASLAALPSPMRFEIDLCCVFENRILVTSGWLFDPANELTMARLRVGGAEFDFLEDSVSIVRPASNPDPSLYRKQSSTRSSGFVFVKAISELASDALDATFTITVGSETVNFPRYICATTYEARQEFLSLLGKMDSDGAIVLSECVAAELKKLPEHRVLIALLDLNYRRAVECLPTAIQHVRPRYSLHIDQAIPVADKGIFLIGWFNAEPAVTLQITCHCGFATYVINDNWARHPRKDVSSYLASTGVRPVDHEHGYSCFVPLENDDAPYFLSIRSETGETRRIRVVLAEKTESALQTVRALLTTFSCQHRDLLTLMDCHVGPAVRTAWAARYVPAQKLTIRQFGTAPTAPSLSIIVPLYGRHDLAEYQMALFADDPEFQNVQLIYVVDDPAIYDEFCSLCADVYGIYHVPFVLAFSGANLGFAGANNFGSGVSSGQYLLFLNSDVMPKRQGWIGELLRIYRALPNPGLLGAKLLYEDGSIQHAGMAFREYPAWGGLWINEHPLKGQSPVELSGVREVPAVTAACALIDAALFRELGGFSEDYIIGDFEDSDLCLRATSFGRRNHIALDVELYHLERQSLNQVGDANWRTNLTLYNCWLHNGRWADRMAENSVNE